MTQVYFSGSKSDYVHMEAFSVGTADGIKMKNIFNYRERQMLF